MPFVAAKAFDFRHRHSLHADLCEGVFHFFEFEWLDDRFNFFHGLVCEWSDWISARGLQGEIRRGAPLAMGMPAALGAQLTEWQQATSRPVRLKINTAFPPAG